VNPNAPACFGFSEGGAMSMLFAATYRQRVRALILYRTRSGALSS
jgi:pimeloyl-ACP methyl ester carboxylesterase